MNKSMKWEHPPISKIYEALGTVADGRVEIGDEVSKVHSSSGNKFYEITYSKDDSAIMANDNASYWKGYLGYPSIAYLLQVGVLQYKEEMGELLKGVMWKDINQKHKNDFDKALSEEVLSKLTKEQNSKLKTYVASIDTAIHDLNLNFLGKKKFPPKGY